MNMDDLMVILAILASTGLLGYGLYLFAYVLGLFN